MRVGLFLLLLLVAAGACGRGDDDAGDHAGPPATGSVGEIPDASEAGLTAWIRGGAYATWAARQPEPIASVAAHGALSRTLFNDTAAAAARAGTTPLPVGSVIVKELLHANGAARGHAVMAKVEAGEGGATWLWYEGFAPEYRAPYYGKGISICTGCHAAGTDFVRTAVP